MSDASAAAAPAVRPGTLRLVALQGASAGERFETALPARAITIGRKPTNDFVLRDDTVSREHAIIEPTPEGWRITARKRGAFLMRAGQEVPEEGALLADGDEIRLGLAVVQVHIAPQEAEDDDRTVVFQAVEAPPLPPPVPQPEPVAVEPPRASPRAAAPPPAAPARRAARERIGRFDVFGPLHESDAVCVDHAADAETGAACTLRRLRSPRLGFFARRRFLGAVERLRGLQHPNLVAPREGARVDGDMVLVYPRVDGTGAGMVLRQGRRGLPIDLAVWIAREVATGLGHVEEALGFGARVALGDGEVVCARDGRVALLLAPPALAPAAGDRFRAPEEDAGGPGDARASMFALGVLLWELLACESVQPGQQATLRSIDAVRIQVPAGLAAVTMRAVELRPEDRFASAADLADALDRELERLTPGYGAETAARWLREHVPDEEGEPR